MPANLLQTTIAIGGKLQASLPAAVRQANLQLMALNRSVMQVNASMTSMSKRWVTGLLGLAGITGIAAVVKEGISLAKEEAGTRAALNNLITNQNKLRGIGLEQSKEQVEMLERQAKALQEQSGIYSGVILKGDAYLAQFRLSARTIQQLQPAFVEILAYQRQMGASAEEIQGVYEQIGKGIMGQTKGLRSIGVELSDYEQRVIKLNARMGNYAANARIIAAEIERQHAGTTKAFRESLGGQRAIAMTRVKTAIEGIGEAFKPLIQLGQIIVSRFIAPLLGPFRQLNKIVLDNWKQWVAYVDRYLVPGFKKLVDQGWQKLFEAVRWFQQNSTWLLPWIKNVVKAIGVWTFVIGPLLRAIALLRAALIGLSLPNPFTALALAAGAAAAYIITQWTQVKKFLGGIWEWIVGTKNFNATLEPAEVMRAFRKGVVPRAQPVQIGWVAQIKKTWSSMLDWLGPETTKKIEDIQKKVQEIFGGLVEWWKQNVEPYLPKVWDDIIKAMGTIRDTYLEALKKGIQAIVDVADKLVHIPDAFQHAFEWLGKINEKWQEFLKSLPGSQQQYVPGMGEPKRPPPPSTREARKQFPGSGIWGIWRPPILPVDWKAHQKALDDTTKSVKELGKQVDITTGKI